MTDRDVSPQRALIVQHSLALGAAFVFGAVGTAYAVDPDLITNCSECCADILGCCCD
jgi:hypothetical protein